MVPVFQSEIEAGIADLIKTDAGIKFFTKASLANVEKVDIPALKKAISSLDTYKDFDLFFFDSILASTGWNSNDDVFAASELWKARFTPVDKKINFMHNEADIIGHMTSSYISNRDNQKWPMDSENWPDNFDLLVGGVLYKIWDNPELQKRMDNLIKEIGEGKWFVSMECLFPNFDYAIIKPDGSHAIIRRDESTAGLSKHLRRYGGTGEHEGYKVGRLLRNLTFNGKGIVDNPANIRSVILNQNQSQIFIESIASLDNLNLNKEVEMADTQMVTKEQYDSAKAEVAALKNELATLNTQIKSMTDTTVENEIKQYKDKVAKAESDLLASKEVSKAHEDNIRSLNDKITQLTAELGTANNELKKVQLEQTKSTRLSMFKDLDVTVEKAQSLVDKFIDANDDMFAEIVAALPKKSTANVNVTQSLANATVEPTLTTVPSTDPTKEIRAKASAWFTSMLATTNKKTENK